MPARCLALVTLATLALAGCQAPPEAADQGPRRKSFEEAQSWQPSAPPAAASPAAGETYEQQADRAREQWDRARQATDDAERQRLAGEALRETRALADGTPAP